MFHSIYWVISVSWLGPNWHIFFRSFIGILHGLSLFYKNVRNLLTSKINQPVSCNVKHVRPSFQAWYSLKLNNIYYFAKVQESGKIQRHWISVAVAFLKPINIYFNCGSKVLFQIVWELNCTCKYFNVQGSIWVLEMDSSIAYNSRIWNFLSLLIMSL